MKANLNDCMKVSIITICLNSQDTIFDCLNSIASQKYPFIECIVIDGGSTDKTLDIIHNFTNLDKKIISEPDAGIYDALNKGMELATGSIVGILHSDDILANNESIATIVKAFEQNPSFQCVHGDLVYVSRFKIDEIKRYWKAGKGSKNQYLLGWMPPHPTFYIKKDLMKKVGGYRMDLGTAADYEFMLRVMVKFSFKSFYIPKVLVKMRIGGISNISLKHRLVANLNDRNAWKVNHLKPYFFTIPFKPLRKIHQFFTSVSVTQDN